MSSENNPSLLLSSSNDDTFVVTNTNPRGTGSLKQAFVDASAVLYSQCNIEFDEELFAETDNVYILMDTTTPIGYPQGEIIVGSQIQAGKKVVLDFGDANPLLTSNNQLSLEWYNCVFKNCKRTGNAIVYISYAGGLVTPERIKFHSCAFIDFSTTGTYSIANTSSSSPTLFNFENCIFVPATTNAAQSSSSWLAKPACVAQFDYCTIWYPAEASNNPLVAKSSSLKPEKSLIISEVNVSGQSWYSTWINSYWNSGYYALGAEPVRDDDGKLIEWFACFVSQHGSRDQDKVYELTDVDYWGRPRATGETVATSYTSHGAIRTWTNIKASNCDSISTALGRSTLSEKRIRCDGATEVKACVVDELTYNIAKDDGFNNYEFPEGSYVWKTNNVLVESLPYPERAIISESDIVIGTPVVTDAGGFELPVDQPSNSLAALPNNIPTWNGSAAFLYSTCVATVDGHKTTYLKATNGQNVIKKTFWLAPLWNAVGGTRSVISGQYWKNEHNDVVQTFSGCEFETYHLDNTITGVTKIDPIYITNRSIKFYQYGENVVYKDTNNVDVTQDLLDAGLIIVVRNSWLTELFGSELVQSALYAMYCPLSVQEADTQFG